MRVILIVSLIDSLRNSSLVSFSISIGEMPALGSFRYEVSSSTIFSSNISPELLMPVQIHFRIELVFFLLNVAYYDNVYSLSVLLFGPAIV